MHTENPVASSQEMAKGLWRCLTSENLGYDLNPVFSHNGRYLAWLSMETPQYEADAVKIKIFDVEKEEVFELAPGWDHSAQDLTWSLDDSRLYFTADIRARSN